MAKFKLPEKDTRVSLEQRVLLDQRMIAQHDPIGARQTALFMRHPHGIAPERCVEIQTLPKEYGTDREGNDLPMAISTLSATPKGELIITTYIGVEYKTTVGKKALFSGEAELLGLLENATPVMLVRRKGDDKRLISYGATTVVEEDTSCAGLLGDGSVMYAARRASGKYSLKRINRSQPLQTIVNSIQGCPCKFALSYGTGRIYVLFRDTGESELYRIEDGELVTVSKFKNLLDIVEIDGFLKFVTDNGIAHSLNAEGDRLESQRPGSLLYFGAPGFQYARWLSRFIDGRSAYVARTKDGLECWVIDKQPQPGFDMVSPLFEKGGEWFYYAYIAGRRQLYTMSIPEFA